MPRIADDYIVDVHKSLPDAKIKTLRHSTEKIINLTSDEMYNLDGRCLTITYGDTKIYLRVDGNLANTGHGYMYDKS